MTINGSPPIHVAAGGGAGTSIATEYGWSPPISMNGATVRAAVGVPSGSYNISAFEGRSAGSVVTPFIVASGTLSIESALSSARVTLNTDGTISITGAVMTGTIQSRWFSSSPGATYYVRGQYTSKSGVATAIGNLVGAAVNTYGSWVALSAAQYGGCSVAVGNSGQITLQFQIATDSGGTNIVATSPVFTVTDSR